MQLGAEIFVRILKVSLCIRGHPAMPEINKLPLLIPDGGVLQNIAGSCVD